MTGRGITMIRPHLRELPPVLFPPGFGIRPMRLDEGPLWLAIERDAEQEYQFMPDGIFEREFGADLESVPRRCFIAVDAQGAGVGTISAWYYTFREQEYGLVHWVAVRPACQGKGLGRAMISFALNRLSQWHDRALLNTDTRRLPAIKLYLDFGFVPVLDLPGAIENWGEVAIHLDHPALAELRKTGRI